MSYFDHQVLRKVSHRFKMQWSLVSVSKFDWTKECYVSYCMLNDPLNKTIYKFTN